MGSIKNGKVLICASGSTKIKRYSHCILPFVAKPALSAESRVGIHWAMKDLCALWLLGVECSLVKAKATEGEDRKRGVFISDMVTTVVPAKQALHDLEKKNSAKKKSSFCQKVDAGAEHITGIVEKKGCDALTMLLCRYTITVIMKQPDFSLSSHLSLCC